MDNQREILQTIQKRREGGLTDEQIRAIFINQGYTDEQLNGLIEESYKELPAASAEPAVMATLKKKGWWPFGRK